jgi:hypothetical protein
MGLIDDHEEQQLQVLVFQYFPRPHALVTLHLHLQLTGSQVKGGVQVVTIFSHKQVDALCL